MDAILVHIHDVPPSIIFNISLFRRLVATAPCKVTTI